MAEKFKEGSYENILNPQCVTGDVNIDDVKIGCSSSTINVQVQQTAAIIVNPTDSVRDVNSRPTVTAVDVKAKLRSWYGKLQLPRVSWMKGENLSLENYFIPLELQSNRRRNNKEDEDDSSDDEEDEDDSSDDEEDFKDAISQCDEILTEDGDDSSGDEGDFKDAISQCDEILTEDKDDSSGDEEDFKDAISQCDEILTEDEDDSSGSEEDLIDVISQLLERIIFRCRKRYRYLKYLNTRIKLENIFGDNDSNDVKRILIESQAGYGKTTLIHRIMNDWVVGKDYVSHFEFAVLLSLKYLGKRSVKKAILEIINMRTDDDERVWEMINNDKTLLLLDGLDEFSEADRQDVLKVLYDNSGFKMTIVVTCRIGLFALNDEETGVVFGGAAKSDEFWDEKVTVLGLNGENRDTFLEKFVEEDNKDKILKKIKELVEELKELFESPLMLIMLVFVTRENPKYKIKNKTDLFKNLIDCIIKRSVNDKHVDELGKFFTLFGAHIGGYNDLFCKFGELSITHVLNDVLQFECDDVTDLIYHLGLLTKHETKLKLETLVHYECFHLTILEFAAAYALWNQFKKNQNRFSSETINQINELQLKKGATSMVIPFLCGLMGEDVKILFTELSDYCGLYSIQQLAMDNILPECELISEELYSAISPFFPCVYVVPNYPSILLTNECLRQNIDTLVVQCDQLRTLAQYGRLDVKFITVFVVGDVPFPNEFGSNFTNKIKCDKLNIIMQTSTNSYKNIANQLIFLLNSGTFNISLLIDDKMLPNVINECVKNDILKGQSINDLCIAFKDEQIMTDAVINIIQNNVVTHFSLTVYNVRDLKNLTNLLSIAASSVSISAMTIVNSTDKKLELSSTGIIQNCNKIWNYISMICVHLRCDKSIPFSNIYSLDMRDPFTSGAPADVELVLSLKLNQLRCTFDLFHSLVQNQIFFKWTGLETVVNLCLFLDDVTTAQMKTLSNLCRFKNLEKLSLWVGGDVSVELQSEIVNCLKSLKIVYLLFKWYDQSSLSSVINIVNGVKALIDTRELQSIHKIDLKVTETKELSPSTSKYAEMISALMNIVNCDSKVTLYLVFLPASTFSGKLVPIFNNFDTSHLNFQQVGYIPGPNEFNEAPSLNILKIQRKNNL